MLLRTEWGAVAFRVFKKVRRFACATAQAGSLIVQRLLSDTTDRAVRGVDFNDDFTKLKQHPDVLAAVGSGRLELLKGA